MSELDGDALLRVDQAVQRFREAWNREAPQSLEGLLREETDGRARADLLRNALAVELEFRRRRGETPSPEEYDQRFPDHLPEIQVAFAEGNTLVMSPGTAIDGLAVATGPRGPGPEIHPERLGKYAVVGPLGRGGQGSAFLARDPDVGRLVVLKRYHAAGEDAAKEAKALCRVRSPYTAQCHDLMRHEGELFLVMEYIPGRSLSEVLAQGRPAPNAAARLAEQVAEGLEAVHACGLVHRDVKPSNVVVGDDGLARLVDFGLAAHLGSADLDSLSGTPPYMAPEQARCQWERIDARTDVYGLGASSTPC